MKRIFSALAILTLSVVGCGDDDDDSGENTGGTAGTMASNGGQPGSSDGGQPASSDGGQPAASGGAPPTGNVACDPEVDGVCQNPTDCPFVESGQARQAAGACGQDCLENGNTEQSCPSECVLMELEMTADCVDCYAAAAVCGIMACAGQCFQDPEAEICQTCLVESGCREDFNTCSGLEQ